MQSKNMWDGMSKRGQSDAVKVHVRWNVLEGSE